MSTNPQDHPHANSDARPEARPDTRSDARADTRAEGAPPTLRAAIVTASDGVTHGTREDRSGDALTVLLGEHGIEVAHRRVVPDERSSLVTAVEDLRAQGVGLVVVTGGTGLGPRDVTPEALAELGGRVVPGFGEVMRATGRVSTSLADLSRSLAIAVGETLVVAVPGSPRGAVESLEAVVDLVPHALDLLAGDTEHGKDPAGDPGLGHRPDGRRGQDDGHDHDVQAPTDGADSPVQTVADAPDGHVGGVQARLDAPAHGADGHVHDEACSTAHGDDHGPEAAGQDGTLMAVFASPLAALLLAWGRELGWETVLVDPRVTSGEPRDVNGVTVVASPGGADASTEIVFTDHHRDELVDLVDAALDTDARFIGLMGSKRHEGPHVGPLRERGRSDAELERIVRPIGLDIGSRTPAEIAISTLADLVARRRLPPRRSA